MVIVTVWDAEWNGRGNAASSTQRSLSALIFWGYPSQPLWNKRGRGGGGPSKFQLSYESTNIKPKALAHERLFLHVSPSKIRLYNVASAAGAKYFRQIPTYEPCFCSEISRIGASTSPIEKYSPYGLVTFAKTPRTKRNFRGAVGPQSGERSETHNSAWQPPLEGALDNDILFREPRLNLCVLGFAHKIFPEICNFAGFTL